MSTDSYFGYGMTGMEELDQALQEIQDIPTQVKIVRAAQRKALKPALEMAQQLVPVDRGDLEKSLVITHRTTKRQPSDVSADAIGMFMGTADPAGHLVEFGTQAHTVTTEKESLFGSVGKEVDIPAIPAKPFVRPAFELTIDLALKIFGEEMWKKIESTAKRLYKQAGSGKLSAAGIRALGVR